MSVRIAADGVRGVRDRVARHDMALNEGRTRNDACTGIPLRGGETYHGAKNLTKWNFDAPTASA